MIVVDGECCCGWSSLLSTLSPDRSTVHPPPPLSMPHPPLPSPERELLVEEEEEEENEACHRRRRSSSRHTDACTSSFGSSHRRSSTRPSASAPSPPPALPPPPRSTNDDDVCDDDESSSLRSEEDASDLLVDRTWCLHAVSPLTSSTSLSSSSSKKNQKKQNTSSSPSSCHGNHHNQRSSSSSSSRIGASASQLKDRLTRDLCHGGDYCQVRWLSTTTTASTTSSSTRGRSQQSTSTGLPILHHDDETDEEKREYHRHLLLEFYAREALAAAIALCFVETSGSRKRRRKRSSRVVHPPLREDRSPTVPSYSSYSSFTSRGGTAFLSSIGFALSRGSHTTCQLVWEWLEWHGGCAIQRHPFCPTSTQLAAAAATWTLLAYRDAYAQAQATQQQQQSGVRDTRESLLRRPSSKRKRSPVTPSGKGSSKVSPSTQSTASSTLTRPLVLTFVPPPSLRGRGLDTVSAVVTPADLRRLCRTLELQPREEEEQRDRDRTPVPSEEVQQNLDPDKSHTPLPILQTLINFVTRETGLPIDQCDLIQASCSIAALGSDGRCKPHSQHYLHDCWAQLLNMVQQRHQNHPSGRTSLLGKNDDDDDTAAGS